jgi:hypothetical protein
LRRAGWGDLTNGAYVPSPGDLSQFLELFDERLVDDEF